MSNIIGLIVGSFAVLSALASIAAFFKANLAQKIIETLKESNAALTEQGGIQKAQIATLLADVKRLTAENQALQNYVSGTDAIKELAASLLKQDAARTMEHHDIVAAIQAIPTVITAQHEEVMETIRLAIHTHASPA